MGEIWGGEANRALRSCLDPVAEILRAPPSALCPLPAQAFPPRPPTPSPALGDLPRFCGPQRNISEALSSALERVKAARANHVELETTPTSSRVRFFRRNKNAVSSRNMLSPG